MKILMVNKYYFIKGGSERYYFELTKILEKNGHEVVPFAMKHPKNFESDFSEYFVDNIEFNLDSVIQKVKAGLSITGRIIYSLQAKRNIDKLIADTKPDIVHLHMIDHQISPSILHAIKKHNLPVIQTAHQSKLICPNYRMYNWSKHQICEKCLGGHFYHPVIEKCHKDSRLAGLIISLESYIHKWIKIYEKHIDLFHVPSRFMGEKFVKAGIDENKIRHIFYTIEIDKFKPSYENKDYFVYYGRLEGAKGLATLLRAMKSVKKSKLMLIGEGDQRENLENFASENNLKNVHFTGYISGEKLKTTVAKSRFVIIPSECYDNSPLVVYEAFSMGKPVIGSAMGGIPELINHGENGLHFEAGNHNQLAERINYLLDNPERILEYGKKAREKAEKEFAPDAHYKKIMKIYQQLLDNKSKH